MPTTKKAAYAHYDGTAYRLTAKALKAIAAGAYFCDVGTELRNLPRTLSRSEDGRLYSNTNGVEVISGEDLTSDEASAIYTKITGRTI